MSEAFVYLWYDALNKMYYLGSSIGKDPNYAHSSSVMESLTMKTKPAHMHRKILAFGTHEEMLALESKLQANRKERCWDRYYNDNVCDGLYHGFGSRENHYNWKGGIKVNDPKAYAKARWQSGVGASIQAKSRAKKKAETGYVIGYSRAGEYKKLTPEEKSEKNARHRANPQTIIKERERRAKNKAETGYAKGYSQAKKKTEKQGVGTLEGFWKV